MKTRTTIYDIAKETGVSAATVTRALNNKAGVSERTRKYILKVAASLGYVANFNARALAGNPIRVCLLMHNHIPVFHSEIIAGVRYQVESLKDMNVVCDYFCLEGAEADIRHQFIQCFDKIIETHPDGIVLLVPSQIDVIYSKVSQLNKEGIRVVLINTDLPSNNRVCCCRQDAESAGRIAAELLNKMVPSGKVAVFTGSMSVVDHANSTEGFRAECKKRNMDVVAVYENHDDYDFATFNTTRLLNEHPEVEGIYINTANSVSVCKKMIESGKKGHIRIITSDVFPEVSHFLNDGVIDATIYQDPFKQGRSAVKALYQAITEKVDALPDVFIQPQIVIDSNLSAYIHSDLNN